VNSETRARRSEPWGIVSSTTETAASAEWLGLYGAPFTEGLAERSLPEAAFRHYLVQINPVPQSSLPAPTRFRSNKSPAVLADMREVGCRRLGHLDVEMKPAHKPRAGLGPVRPPILNSPSGGRVLAYTRYVLDAGMRGDLSVAQGGARAVCVDRLRLDRDALPPAPMRSLQKLPIASGSPICRGTPIRKSGESPGLIWKGLADLYATRPARQS